MTCVRGDGVGDGVGGDAESRDDAEKGQYQESNDASRRRHAPMSVRSSFCARIVIVLSRMISLDFSGTEKLSRNTPTRQ